LAETSNICDFDCEYCYTVLQTLSTKSSQQRAHLKPLPGELSLDQRLELIDQAVELGAATYDIVGAGEPLLDPCFWKQIEYANLKGLVPVVFTNGSRLGDPRFGEKFVQRLWDSGASIVVKWHSADHALHDSIVRRPGAAKKRDEALRKLCDAGFNKSSPTRLGIDNIMYRRTLAELPHCLRMCRENNMFLLCSTFIPSGRTKKGFEEEASPEEIFSAMESCQRLDTEEFRIRHTMSFPFLGYGRTCTQYIGLYVTIQGDVFGCVGKTSSFGNIASQSIREMWKIKQKELVDYDGGCPPRKKYYEAKANAPSFLRIL
jgi:MoaA/NifB/PqqE/SkfB family radical SAM enzyme